MIKNLKYIILLLILLQSCDKTEPPDNFYNENLTSIRDYIAENLAEFSIFHDIMMQSDLDDPLNSYNPYGNGFTLFLPTDHAFHEYVENNTNYNSIDDLLADEQFIRILGRYHLVNSQYNTNEFPYGELPDTTATGDFLTVGFSHDIDSTVFKINNVSPVVVPNLEMQNGIVHVIEKVLEPVNYSSLEWLKDDGGFSILTDIFDKTGLTDTMGLFRNNSGGQLIRNNYTVLAEHDSIFNRNGIYSADDLIQKYGDPDIPESNPQNPVYQFAAYHILEGRYFLADFTESRNYNSYANSPVRINSGLEIMINAGVDTFKYIVDQNLDTTYINYLSFFYQESNILTKNGAIHFLSEVMEYYVPRPSKRSFEFLEETEFKALQNTTGNYLYYENEQDVFEVLSWVGSEYLLYYKSSSNSEKASNKDYIMVGGNFVIHYTMPKVLPGRYNVFIRAHAYNRNNEHATINVYLDEKKLGASYDLNASGEDASNPYTVNDNADGFNVGQVEFTKYESHTITIESLIPGIMIWDRVQFQPYD